MTKQMLWKEKNSKDRGKEINLKIPKILFNYEGKICEESAMSDWQKFKFDHILFKVTGK